ncbi:MAG TPA: PRC-barrel domain-containing protein [Candidatus Dormibacteraeota bacterium]
MSADQPGSVDEDFHLGAAVHSSDGREIGTLSRLIVGKDDLRLKAFVVKENRRFSGHLLSPGSWLLADEAIVPRGEVSSVSRDHVVLKLTANNVRNLPAYLSYRYGDETATQGLTEEAISALSASPAIPSSLEQVANKGADELEIEGGENVMLGHTGKRLGTVKDVLFDDSELVGVVILPDGVFKQEVILPRRFLQRSDDLALFAGLTDDDVEQLKPFEPAG